MEDVILTQCHEGVLEIVFNRPDRLNAMTLEFFQKFNRALDEADHEDVRAVLIRGQGKAFSVGGDIKLFAQMANQGQAIPVSAPDSFHKCIEKMRGLPKPVVGAIHGACAGAGFSVAMACDLVLAAESCKINLAYAGIGLSPDGGASFFLPRHVGTKLAAEILMTGRTFSAQEALQWGLVNQVLADDGFEDIVRQQAFMLAKGPTLAYAKIKTLLNASMGACLEEQLRAEAQLFSQSSTTKDFKAGVNGFLEKRFPQFSGQ